MKRSIPVAVVSGILTVMGARGLAAQSVPSGAGSPASSGHEPPPREIKAVGELKLHDFAAKWMMQQDDLPEVGHYAAANAGLSPPSPSRPRVVLMGDSITYHWTAEDLPTPPWMEVVNRGVVGQNTSQMLLRFEDDVVALKPAAVVILGGANDLRVYVGDPAAAEAGVLARIERNVAAMADIANANGVKVVICAITPFGADHRGLQRDPATLRAANAWLKTFAASRHYPFADYYGVLADASGDMPASLSKDGLHPTAEGHRRMWPQLQAALEQLKLR
jgi:lysophospholipase L1-like esterase